MLAVSAAVTAHKASQVVESAAASIKTKVRQSRGLVGALCVLLRAAAARSPLSCAPESVAPPPLKQPA